MCMVLQKTIMLDSSVTLITLGLIIILALFFLNWLKKINIRRKTINKIPGPQGIPIFGSVLQFMKPSDQLWNYVRYLAKEHYPLYKMWQIGIPGINILSPEDMEVVLSTTKHTKKGLIYSLFHPWLGTGLLTSAGSKWQTRRKILTPTFHFSILQQFLGVFIEGSELLVKTLQKECDKPYTNIVPIITQFTLHSLCQTAMGTKLNMEDKKWKDYAKAIFRVGEILVFRVLRPWYLLDFTFWLSPKYREQKALLNVVHTFSNKIIADRKKNFIEPELQGKHDDGLPKRRLAMLDLLISAKNAGEPIDDEGIREEVDTFMFEGHDTTTACLSFTLLLLACHKDIQEKVFQELQEVFGDSERPPTYQDLQNLPYLEMVLKESLRIYPSVPFISRVSDNEEIHTPSGYTIPPNTVLLLHIYDLHHNATHFPEPEKFDPDRFLPENAKGRHPFAYIPFSAGPRNCIGQKFAILEIKTLVSAILRNFVLEPIDTPSNITMIVHVVLKAKDGIRIKFQERRKY